MIAITLPDGSIKNCEPGVTPFDVAMSISEGLARNVISATFNERVVETCTSLDVDGSLTLHTWQNEEGKKAFWHSSAHILAQALEQLYPGRRNDTVLWREGNDPGRRFSRAVGSSLAKRHQAGDHR